MAADTERASRRRIAAPQTVLRSALRHPDVTVAVVIVAIVAVWVLWPGLLAPGDPLRSVPLDRLQPPSPAHPFGTDELGRDLYTRVVNGASLSIRSTALAVAIGLITGSLIGAVAGYLGGVVDGALMRLIDVVLAIPGLLLSLALIAALGAGTLQIAIAVGVGSIPSFARVVRAETLRVRASDYIEAVHTIGARGHTVLLRHVLPNIAGQALVLATATLGTAVLAVSALSFLGFGAAPPAPEWGNLISGGRNYLGTAWWLTVLPSMVVVGVVISINRISRAIDRQRRSA